jgi:membrane fusion protein (multidrug efflux system)
MRRILSLTLLCPLLIACNPKASPHPKSSQAPAVVTATVQLRTYALPIEAIGTAHARESVLVTSRVSGRVSRIYMTEGAGVRAGDPLVLLEDDTEKASLRTATASAAEAESQYLRLQSLSDRGLVSQYERDRQRQVLEKAQAELELARVLLDQRTIRAPFSGVVGFRAISPGTLVQPGTGIVTLDAREHMRVMFSVAETLVSSISVGEEVQAGAAAYRGRKYSGRIETLGTRLDEATRAMPVQALFRNTDGSLIPGMMLTLRISAKPRKVIFIPEAALAPENARQFVWRVSSDGLAQRVAVELGVRGDGWVEIVSGLAEGERVVLEGSGNLRQGTVVREVPAPGTPLAVMSNEG